jgi:hypothetical protein
MCGCQSNAYEVLRKSTICLINNNNNNISTKTIIQGHKTPKSTNEIYKAHVYDMVGATV